MTDEKIAAYFSFLRDRGFRYERDYNKGTDKTCTVIYRFTKDGANYLEFRALSARERTTCVCVNGEKKFPNLAVRDKKFIRKWKLGRLFSPERKDEWLLAADLCRYEIESSGTLFGIKA